jgi:hypothetical protein
MNGNGSGGEHSHRAHDSLLDTGASSGRSQGSSSRLARAVLALVIVELTAATAYIHFSLGGTLFLLNAVGYVALAAAYAVVAWVPTATVQRFGWLPRIALPGYALLTIGAYLWIGPWFSLGWIAKGIEVAIVGLVVVDVLGAYGSPTGLVRAAIASLPIARRGGGLRHA